MKLVSDREMLAIRMEIAVWICTKFPDLYNKSWGQDHNTITEEEATAYNILFELMKLEPVIRKVLELYYS